MIFGEYSYEDDIRVQRQEAFEEGQEAGIEKGAQAKAIESARNFLKETDLSAEKIARCCSLPLEDVLKLKSEVEKENSL